MDAQTILNNVTEISGQFAEQRSERQRRRELVRADFDQLRDAGYLLTAVPTDQGGIWKSVPETAPEICEILRVLAGGDPSVALVASMHPAVINAGGWLTNPAAPAPYTDVWEQQRRWVSQMACDGHYWGTIISEPGSGGDVSKTVSDARPGPEEGTYLVSGRKHFGSGSGITSFMMTRAVPEGETEPDTFFMDMRDVPWDGSKGVKLAAAWDGHGMTATQSHAMEFHNFPAVRSAWPNRPIGEGPAGGMFTAVIVGVVENAIAAARRQLEGKRNSMRAYEQTEWSRVEIEGWLVQQAYQGMLRAIREIPNPSRSMLLSKEAIAGLAESAMVRLSKIIGGSAYSRHLPYGFWLEDVRALGFLRPPWGLAFDRIFQGSWPEG